jgi:hypothetical protein
VRLAHAELSESRGFDDAEYRLAVDVPATVKPGDQLTAALWRGAESPDGRRVSEGLQISVEREDRVAPATGRARLPRAGDAGVAVSVHAGTSFARSFRCNRRAR